MNSEETAWVAGLLEGEGSFYVGKSGVVAIAMGMHERDRDIVERLQKYAGGIIYGPYKNRPVLHWKISNSKDIIKLIPQIIGLLGNRRTEQAEKLLLVVSNKKQFNYNKTK